MDPGPPGGPPGGPPDPPGGPLPGLKNECTFPGLVFARVRAAAAIEITGIVCVAIERL
jgi:hypothetical protein